MITRILIFMMILGLPGRVMAQKPKKAPVQEGALYFTLTSESQGKKIVIVKDNGKIISKDSLKMADGITAYYKVGQKTTNVKDIVYDSYFLSDTIEPTILQDMHGLTFDKSIWVSCIDSMHKKQQIVFQIREITLDDGTKIQDPKLVKESKAVYKVMTNPNFPEGGWQAKANQWISRWKDWFKPKDASFYKLDDKVLELYATGIVFTIK